MAGAGSIVEEDNSNMVFEEEKKEPPQLANIHQNSKHFLEREFEDEDVTPSQIIQNMK